MRGQSSAFAKSVARDLRRGATDAERKLWQHLRGGLLGVRFRRQHPYEKYVLDFVCIEKRLVIEVDGLQHDQSQSYDEERTRSLQSAGFRVLRFDSLQVLNETNAVVQVIHDALNPSPPRPSP